MYFAERTRLIRPLARSDAVVLAATLAISLAAEARAAVVPIARAAQRRRRTAG